MTSIFLLLRYNLFIQHCAVERHFKDNQANIAGKTVIITSHLPRYLGQETAKRTKRPCSLRVKLPPVHLTRWRLRTFSLLDLKQESCEYLF